MTSQFPVLLPEIAQCLRRRKKRQREKKEVEREKRGRETKGRETKEVEENVSLQEIQSETDRQTDRNERRDRM